MWGRWSRFLRRGTWDEHDVPDEVVDAANHEAWRQTGFGRGGRSADLMPADCGRLDGKSFRCVAKLMASRRGPTVRFEIDIEQASSGGEVVVSRVTRSERQG
jgi:hypothetical protein